MSNPNKRKHSVIPWWVGYLHLLPFRKYLHDPGVLGRYIREGMNVLEVGPGMGYFTLPMARMVGKSGKIYAVDIQERMLARLRKRAAKTGLIDRIEIRKAAADSVGVGDLAGKMDAVVAIFVLHEMPDAGKAFAEFYATLKPGGFYIFAEPADVVKQEEFEESLELARNVGFTVKEDFQGFRATRGNVLVK